MNKFSFSHSFIENYKLLSQILENAYMLALQTMRPAVSTISHANDLIISQATSLKEISWNKVNQILSTHYGSVAVQSIDSTAIIVDKLIDRYFPPIEEEEISGLFFFLTFV